jgi:HEAT repeat protein
MRRLSIFLLSSSVALAQAPTPPKPASVKAAPKAPGIRPPEPEPSAPMLAKADKLLADGLKDKNPDTRKEVVAAIGLAGTREPYLGEIHGALEDKDLYVRLAAVASLVDLEHKESAPGLIKALYDETPEVSFAAAKALWQLGDPTGRAALLGVISGDTKTSSGALTAKKRDMLRMFQTPRTLVLFAIRQGSGMVPFPGVGEGVSSLTLLMEDQGASGRSSSVLLVGKDKSPEVVQVLRDALRDKDVAVRAASVHSLVVQDNPAFIDDMVPLMDDQREAVRFRAAAGYIRLTGIQHSQWAEREKLRTGPVKKAVSGKK